MNFEEFGSAYPQAFAFTTGIWAKMNSVPISDPNHNGKAPSPDLTDQLKAAADLLESIANDRQLLAKVAPEVQKRLVSAAGKVFQPDNVARRRLVKANRRQDKAAKIDREKAALSETGIRKLRREEGFQHAEHLPACRLRTARCR